MPALPVLRGTVVAIDTETTGLKTYRGHKPFCFAYHTNKGEKGWHRIGEAEIEWLKNLASDRSKRFVFHYAKFDIRMLRVFGIRFDLANVDCTLIQSKLLNGLLPDHSLRSLSIRFLNRTTDDKDEIEAWVKAERRRTGNPGIGFEHAPDDVVKRRNMWDAESTILLDELLRPQILKNCATLYETEMTLMRECLRMEDRGVLVDLSRTRSLRDEAVANIRTGQQIIDKIICPLTIIRKKKRKRQGVKVEVDVEEVYDTFNPGSPIQMEAGLRKAGIELIYQTKPKKKKKGSGKTGGGRWAFDEYALTRYVNPALVPVIRNSSEQSWPLPKLLSEAKRAIETHRLSEKDLLIPMILKTRELSKMVSTYYDNLIDGATDVVTEPSGREVGVIHCSFNQSEAMTGRFSASEPNLQNMPRLMGPRECFVTRRGYVHLHFDYSQVEMKFFVHFARDPDMAEALKGDIHRHTGAKIYGVPAESLSDERRKRSKAVNFGVIYGSGYGTIAETLTKKGLPTTPEVAAEFLRRYHREFPSVKRATNSFKTALIRQGFIENPFGRRYHIPSQYGYRALNYMCQGTSADLMKRAMVECAAALRLGGFKTQLIMTVHDELVFEAPKSEVRKVVPIIHEIMNEPDMFFVPITVDLEVVTNRWSEKHDPKDLGITFKG